jgi:hypothetical protein
VRIAGDGLGPDRRSSTNLRLAVRATAAVATLFAGIYFVGRGYPHLCDAGSSVVECAGMIGVPLAAAAAVGMVRRYRIGLTVALCLLAADYAAREPYLKWVHGPNSPWPGMSGGRPRGRGVTPPPQRSARSVSVFCPAPASPGSQRSAG